MEAPGLTNRGRFAPSPTGPLHIGSLFTALASFLEAKCNSGEWLVRIDDIDSNRTVDGAADHILRSLDALGLHWDGTVLYQSRALERYREALSDLKNRGLLYTCSCSRKDLNQETIPANTIGVYPGYCRDKHLSFKEGASSLRLRLVSPCISFEDTLQGYVEQNLEEDLGDFILYRRDGMFAYHLATVLDDAFQEVTQIVRGHDLLHSTPRQIYLQTLFGAPQPTYTHVPILTDQGGLKFSKSYQSKPVEAVTPSSVLMYLLELLNQSPPKDLSELDPEGILAWGIQNWDPNRLLNIKTIPIEAEHVPL